jgi:hypothetical protein
VFLVDFETRLVASCLMDVLLPKIASVGFASSTTEGKVENFMFASILLGR